MAVRTSPIRGFFRGVERVLRIPLLSYSTDKEVRFHDTTLSLVHKLLFTLATTYMLVEILFRHKYATFEVPAGTVNTWSDFALHVREPLVKPKYCDNSEYDVYPTLASGNFEALNISCRALTSYEVVTLAATSFSANTFVQVKFNGTVENTFVTNVEDVAMNLQHSFSTSFMAQTNLNTKVFDHTGSVVMSTSNGEPLLGITVGQLLRWAGVDLDEHAQAAEGLGVAPFLRLTGVVILVKLEYTNFREWDFADRSPHCRIRFTVQSGLWGYLGPGARYYSPTSMARTETMAVRFLFITEGQLGQFSFYDLLVSILSGTILVSVATAFVNHIGSSWLPLAKRRRFNLAMTEHVILDSDLIDKAPSLIGLGDRIHVGQDGRVTHVGSAVSFAHSRAGSAAALEIGNAIDGRGVGSVDSVMATVVPVFDDDDDYGNYKGGNNGHTNSNSNNYNNNYNNNNYKSISTSDLKSGDHVDHHVVHEDWSGRYPPTKEPVAASGVELGTLRGWNQSGDRTPHERPQQPHPHPQTQTHERPQQPHPHPQTQPQSQRAHNINPSPPPPLMTASFPIEGGAIRIDHSGRVCVEDDSVTGPPVQSLSKVPSMHSGVYGDTGNAKEGIVQQSSSGEGPDPAQDSGFVSAVTSTPPRSDDSKAPSVVSASGADTGRNVAAEAGSTVAVDRRSYALPPLRSSNKVAPLGDHAATP